MSDEITKKGGMVPAVIACVFSILGIFILGIIFVPIASIFALFGTFFSIKTKNSAGIATSIAAWILVIIAFFTSPALIAAVLGIFGIASSV